MNQPLLRWLVGVPGQRRRDPVLLAAALLIAAIVAWSAIPPAMGVSAGTDTTIQLNVPTQIAVTPGLTLGDTSVNMPDLSSAGQQADATSAGWKFTTNHITGYDLRIRSTTDPAMRGKNAVDTKGAPGDAFLDFKTASECPCPWTTSGYTKGVFGYSASVTTNSGPAPLEGDKWGTTGHKQWRGLDNTSFRLFQTSGGTGNYSMSLHFRTAIPTGGSQKSGSYRSTVILSIHALL